MNKLFFLVLLGINFVQATDLVQAVQKLNFEEVRDLITDKKYTVHEHQAALSEIAIILKEKEQPIAKYKNFAALGKTALFGGITYYLGNNLYKTVARVLDLQNKHYRYIAAQLPIEGFKFYMYYFPFCIGLHYTGKAIQSFNTCHNPHYTTSLAIFALLRAAKPIVSDS